MALGGLLNLTGSNAPTHGQRLEFSFTLTGFDFEAQNDVRVAFRTSLDGADVLPIGSSDTNALTLTDGLLTLVLDENIIASPDLSSIWTTLKANAPAYTTIEYQASLGQNYQPLVSGEWLFAYPGTAGGGSSAQTFTLTTNGVQLTGTLQTYVIADDSVTLAQMAGGTDGNLITYDTSGNPAHVATGANGQVLTSNGAGTAPTFQAQAGGGDMTTVVYDPGGVADDVFDMAQMTEAADAKVLTGAERTLLGNTSGANTGDEAAASATVSGVVELATVAETDTGTDATRAVTPAGLAGSALQTKVNGVESGATADQTGGEIKTVYEGEADTNAFTDAQQTKLSGIETSADVTDETNVTGALDGATLTEKGTPASGDKFLIQDNAAADALKWVDFDNLPSAGGGLSNVVEDTTPQLGGMLDVNGQAIGDGTLELLTFVEDASAVNQLEIENEATGAGPILRATGDDATVDLHLATKSTGQVIVDATLDVQGAITVTSTVDGRDVATDGTKLDGVETAADVTDATNVAAAGAHMSGGTDVPITDGGTGSSTAGAARTALGTDDAANLTTGTISAARVGADHIDTITEIASPLKSGADAVLITGTAGSTNEGAKFNADGDLVTTGVAAPTTLPRQVGKEPVWVPAAAMKETVSNGCAAITTVETTAGQPDLQVLDFDATADEHAQFSVAFPKAWNLGTVTFQVFWTVTAAVSTGVAWGLQGLAVSDNEAVAQAYGTSVVVTDDAQGASNEVLVSAESSAITIAGTPADDDLCYFRLFRDVSDANDDMTQDARLKGIKFFFTSDLANDD